MSSGDAVEKLNNRQYGPWTLKAQKYFTQQQTSPTAWWWDYASSATLLAVGTAMKGLIACGFYRVYLRNVDKLVATIEDPDRKQPVITYANHLSTMDDPLLWGLMPLRMLRQPDLTRWSLGAKELTFFNPFFAAFFSLGQTIPTMRGSGIYQDAVNIAIKKLNEKKWVHVFPESFCNQKPEIARLKWGVGRMIMESEINPIVIPIYHHGMTDVLPLGQPLPIPRFSPFKRKLLVSVGDPIDFADLLEAWKKERAMLKDDKDKEALDRNTRIKIVEILRVHLNVLKKDGDKFITSENY
ncbi:Lyso-phosphatidylcholine acyltransferase [Mycoemilia scoparia]|uniref:Tafazzin family protein n=1 Tax=Mycoemilia scoparia TaxID=417184 RepID=A0A9W8A527_9FUNG|nr:Lyso-phosphatidylcholine acyltransferase [Mycoemilia scoparia]